MGFYLSYLLLLKPPVLMHSCYSSMCGKIWPVANFMELHTLTQAACSYALLIYSIVATPYDWEVQCTGHNHILLPLLICQLLFCLCNLAQLELHLQKVFMGEIFAATKLKQICVEYPQQRHKHAESIATTAMTCLTVQICIKSPHIQKKKLIENLNLAV